MGERIELPRIDTSVRRVNMGGSRSVPASPTAGPQTTAAALGELSLLRQPATHQTPARTSFVQSGRMTKLPHYGRLRSVTARVLRMMDPRTLAQRQTTSDERGAGGANGMSAQIEDGSYGGTAAGVLGLSVMDTVRDAAGRRIRQRRFSHGSLPIGGMGLSRHGSRESRFTRLRLSLDEPQGRQSQSQQRRRLSDDRASRASERMWLAEPASAVSRTPSGQSGGNIAAAAVESVIAIPMPGFFLDAASDDWTGGHSFRQRMRYPDEAITVPASLTKRVHYEVSYDYPKNAISTARYNVVTFLPAQLAAQFSKVANIYFLFIAALQQVPGWSTTGRWTTILPLSIFVCLSIAHEGFDDIRRHRMDHAENAQRTRVLKVKVHDRQRLSFSFRDLRHRGSQSIHSFRMRSSQSIHEIGRNTLEGARRWAVATWSVGSTVREHVGKRLAEKRRKKREMEDSDDEDELVINNARADDDEGDDVGGDGAESLLRRQITRGVLSLRSWRGTGIGAVRTPTAVIAPGGSAEDSNSEIASVASRARVAFRDEVEELAYDNNDDVANPLPDNMSCRWKKKRWENVQVGDLLMISKDEWIPADCVVIASTGFDGTCFVETAALDGETTLKQKQALEATNGAIQTPEQLAAFSAFTFVEPASPELYSFEGFMEIDGTRHALTPNQLLLRGSVLRNTAYVFAQVVYAGEHTRLRLNATRNVRTKAPQIQRITNRVVVLVFALLLALCLVFAGLGIHWNDDSRRGHWYLSTVSMPAAALVFGYIVMMNALIPISLYVTLEAVKIFQCWFITQDACMYDPASDSRAEARTTAINEDLGMVRYVFSDKTGTLTENIMKLRALMVAGFSFLHVDVDRLLEARDAELSKSGDDGNSAAEPMRSPSPSPSLFRTQLFARHRRQHSMPSPPVGDSAPQNPRVLQQLAAANRARHTRGSSASVLRSPPVPSPLHSPLQHEVQPLLGAEPDPDVSDDPRTHARAAADAPVSDLQQLPSSRQITDATHAPPTDVFRARAQWFLRCMALCHTVQPDRDPLTGRITGYQATSPDEKALVAAAAELGYVMNNRAGPLVQLRVVASERMRDFNCAVVGPESPKHVTPLTTPGTATTATAVDSSEPSSDDEDGSSEQSFDRGVPAPHPTDRLGNYEVLDVLEFSSARKRMSVILRCPDGRIVMMSKGADSALWPRLRRPERMQSDPRDSSFRPRPTPPPDKFAAAMPAPLLLRRKLSQPSAAYRLHSRHASMSSSPLNYGDDAMVTPPPRAATPTATPTNDAEDTMYFGQLSDPLSAPATAPHHRRLMSDSQFSAFSEASSFADTQGQVDIPASFDTPTREEEEWARTRALEALHQFSTEGLRTLVYAHKEIAPSVYDAWHARYAAACTALSGRQQQVEAVCEEIESDLLLSGVSAIEDRLQEGVPETIFKLRRAGVRVWMLTGDKVETAINIAKSCRLIDTECLETTALDPDLVEQARGDGKMILLVMQSVADPDELDRVVARALDVAQAMVGAASVDQRFERRSKRDKLRRGFKKFGNLLDPRRRPQAEVVAGIETESEITKTAGDSDSVRQASLAVVVDGETLAALESNAQLLERFLLLGTLCDAVICSRVSPSQKALIVHNMRVRCEGGASGSHGGKSKLKASLWARWIWRPVRTLLTHDNDQFMVTLAIGDGGNDIAMIQEAHVGIGIAGQEGLQASRAADFSIGQFRFLQRLLLVHGRWSYVRVSMFIMGTFYKCMAFYATQLIYQFYTGFSGTSLFESWTLSMYNTLFSILPVLVVGIFEQDLQPQTLLDHPELYRDMGPANHLFTVPEFLRRVVVIGIVHAIIAAYFPFAGGLLLGHDGTTNDQYINSLVVFSIMVLIVTLKIAYIDVRRWVVFSHASVVLSLALWFGWNGVLGHVYPSAPSDGYFVLGVFDMLMRRATFWFQWIIFAAVALCLNVLFVVVYSVRDPIEQRILSWVARERRQEHVCNQAKRKQWIQDHNIPFF